MHSNPVLRTPQYTAWWWGVRMALLARGWTWEDARAARRDDGLAYFLDGDPPEVAAWKIATYPTIVA